MTRRPQPRHRPLILILIVCFVIYFLGFIICRQIISGTAITIYIFSSFTNHAVTRLASSPLGSNVLRVDQSELVMPTSRRCRDETTGRVLT